MRDKTKLFGIGDVARLFHLSVSSLRHYENEGLLTPEYVDPHTGYRYYSPRQFEVLNTIRYLRVLDMPLSEIADFLANRDVDRIEEKLLQQKIVLENKMRELARIERKIDNRLRGIEDAKTAPLGVMKRIRTPASKIVWMTMADSLHIAHYLDMETPVQALARNTDEAVVFLGKVGVGISAEHLTKGMFSQYDGVFLVLDDEDQYSGEVICLPETECIEIRFQGSHPEAPAAYEKLMQYIHENSLYVTGFSREITLIDYGFTNDTEKFVTEIRIPIAEQPADIDNN